MIMNMLVESEVKANTRIRSVDLGYNNISMLLQNSINKLLGETELALMGTMQDENNLESTSNFNNMVTGDSQ